ncbi:hypothetical protein PABY_13930 [Pyrodictium abyssi]|uniref:Transposase n=1 Tax=Pyrodictium abyssi TaxID=54256 RepID=A0ABM8IW82_9CREN|nr:hypothetical protein PABY_13930 [Pyrodictium abyssi]
MFAGFRAKLASTALDISFTNNTIAGAKPHVIHAGRRQYKGTKRQKPSQPLLSRVLAVATGFWASLACSKP